VSASVVGSQIVFRGTPTEASVFDWYATVYDKGFQHSSERLDLTAQIFDTSVTTPSTDPRGVNNEFPVTQNYYHYGPDHCCALKAVVSSGHPKSGSPAGTVSFFVDGIPEGTAPLNFSYYNLPASTTATLQSATTIGAGVHILKAVFNSDPYPLADCYTFQGMKNCFLASSSTTSFTVLPAPTQTGLSMPTKTAGGGLQFGVGVRNDTAKIGGFAQVDPGTPVDLLMDNHVVDSVPVTLVSQPMPDFVVRPPAGKHTFVARYRGDANELPSVSLPTTVDQTCSQINGGTGSGNSGATPGGNTLGFPLAAQRAGARVAGWTSLLGLRLSSPILADEPPTPAQGDPKGGYDVAGGKVHRGTGTHVNPNDPNDKRAAFYLWLDRAENSDCNAEYGWYQFLRQRATVIDNAGVEHDVTKALAKGGAIPSSTGAVTRFGEWSGDTYKKDEDELKKQKKPIAPHQIMPGSSPPVDGGQYEPKPIPGTNGTQGLIDAPNLGNTGGYQRLVDRLMKAGIVPTKAEGQGPQPPPDLVFTLVVTTTFQTYLFKLKPAPATCLGYSTQNYTETMKLRLIFGEPNIQGEGGLNKVWKVTKTQVASDDDVSAVTFGPWQACPEPKKKGK
jgi:hypothetical protein